MVGETDLIVDFRSVQVDLGSGDTNLIGGLRIVQIPIGLSCGLEDLNLIASFLIIQLLVGLAVRLVAPGVSSPGSPGMTARREGVASGFMKPRMSAVLRPRVALGISSKETSDMSLLFGDPNIRGRFLVHPGFVGCVLGFVGYVLFDSVSLQEAEAFAWIRGCWGACPSHGGCF